MKKSFLIAAMTLFAIGANAAKFESSCGKVTTTVDPEFFDTTDELADYLDDLNYALCKEIGDYHYSR